MRSSLGMLATLLLATSILISLPGEVPAVTINVAAAFDASESPTLAKNLNRSFTTVNRDVLRDANVTLVLIPLPVGGDDAENNNRSYGSMDGAVIDFCAAVERHRVAVVLVVGSGAAARGVVMAAGAAAVPVIWARNDSQAPLYYQAMSAFEVNVDPSWSEMSAAIRHLLLAAHWHTYSIVSDASAGAAAVRAALAPLAASSSVLLRSEATPLAVFHRLAELQRATRGVVVLLAEEAVARATLRQAQRLHMLSSDWVWLLVDAGGVASAVRKDLSLGMLSLLPRPARLHLKQTLRALLKTLALVIKKAVTRTWLPIDAAAGITDLRPSCFRTTGRQTRFANKIVRDLRSAVNLALAGESMDPEVAPLASAFDLLNLVAPEQGPVWKTVGNVIGRQVSLETIVWPGGDIVGPSPGGRSVFRVVTALAPPFVMEGLLEDGQCLRGLKCHRVPRSAGAHQDNMTLLFSWEPEEELTADHPLQPTCCYGLSMDLLENVAQELEFDFHLYLVSDGFYGSRVWSKDEHQRWNGIIGDLVTGAAHMSFAALSVSSARSEIVDFSAPYYFSGISLLVAPSQHNEIPLLAFLLPFSPELWVAIFTSLNVTAVAVAIYEWLSPFGLNPWGRQRSKNFSLSSALWVMWGLLCGHLVAFKAPKSWPNKFLINIWGGFSVIFVASYTANIAALIAGHFFQNSPSFHDRSLLSQRIGSARSSVAEYYVQTSNQPLWEHMQQFTLRNLEEGVHRLRNGTLDMLIGDTPVLDYYRANDPGCKLQAYGDPISQDMYAVGMNKGFPLKDSISAVIAKYASNGYLDILQEKWYGGLPCFRLENNMVQPRPLGVTAVAGVFLLLGLGMVVGLLILIVEHIFYRNFLPSLRNKPKGTIWRSRNVMFFSQKLYRFINCVELVSPHHAARELMHTLRQGQITSLFQKSVKREHEQRRRRKSKAQFFEMIQEIRRVQAEERDLGVTPSSITSPITDFETSELTSLKTPASEAPPPPPPPPPEVSRPRLPVENSQTGCRLAQFRQDSLEQQVPSLRHRRSNCQLASSPINQEDPAEEPSTDLTTVEWQMRETELRRQLLNALREKDELRDQIRILERRVKEPP
ncbi:glutamate receptor ionotropic, NMDA 3A-like isoform X2 [Neocloeon triangulifer]|uniref:glutamate receptor ionotropic, NMDA 3A-like isoform X2 n=1 Tax=Neocloeon triangulifer TaxID=2078957 RepID=UPI00286F81D9|nr:glutamate receptor ionotropic, NMDA 3A-like isoform X2 [Neocloeon triangulifer]